MEGGGEKGMEREREIEERGKVTEITENTKKEKRTKERPHRGIAKEGGGKVQESADAQRNAGN